MKGYLIILIIAFTSGSCGLIAVLDPPGRGDYFEGKYPKRMYENPYNSGIFIAYDTCGDNRTAIVWEYTAKGINHMKIEKLSNTFSVDSVVLFFKSKIQTPCYRKDRGVAVKDSVNRYRIELKHKENAAMQFFYQFNIKVISTNEFLADDIQSRTYKNRWRYSSYRCSGQWPLRFLRYQKG